jgi:hypothetical protein
VGSRAQAECEADCYEVNSFELKSAMAGPTTCTAWDDGTGTGSGSGSGH